MVIWIVNSLTPQEIRDRIMDKNSTFQKKMVVSGGCSYRQVLNGSHQQVQQKVSNNMIQSDYISPTETLLLPPLQSAKDELPVVSVQSVLQ